MSSSTSLDIFSEVRKYGSSSNTFKADNYAVLVSVEESIMKNKSIKRETITPENYFFAIMTMLNTRTMKYRSVRYFQLSFYFSCFICFRQYFPLFQKQ